MINNKLQNLKILDCTFRDGGYYNNWDFDEKLIQQYITSLEKSGIFNIEIGFRFYDQDFFLGPLAYSTDLFLKKFKFSKKTNLCVMVNASELIEKKKPISFLFDKRKNSKIKTIRFATHFREINNVIKYLKQAKKLGYNIIINLMQSNDRSENDIKKAILKLKKTNCISVLYFADSLGKMHPQEIDTLIQIAKKYWNKELGIHTHENKGYALANTIQAIYSGVKWVDSTILGMGRGAGNVQTEIILSEFENSSKFKYKLKPIFSLVEGSFSELKNKYKWGKSLTYFLAAKYNIHPTYIQTLENDKRYNKEKIYEIINYLKKIDAKSFNKEKLFSLLKDEKKNFKGKWDARNWCKNENIVLIGPGNSVEKYKNDIEKFISNQKFKTICLNINSFINEKYVDFYVASNENRIMLDINKYNKIKKPIILPYQRVKKMYDKINLKNVKDYGLIVSQKKISVNKNFCILPNSLVFGYAIALCTIGMCKSIYLIGFDGYNNEDPLQQEMLNLIKSLKLKFKKIKMISLTPTTYPIKKSSIYAKNF